MPGHGHKKSLENLSMERHGYSDSNPKVSISEINFKNDESELIQGLGEFFYREYRNELPDRHGRKRAFDKAQSLVEGNFDNSDILGGFNYQEGFHKALKQAISHGYIWKIEIEKPWHPKFFFNFDKIKTFPFQHKEIVLWTGQPKHRFFSEAGKIDILQEKDFDEFFNPDSAFNQNGIRVSTRHTDKSDKWASHNEAVYLAHSLGKTDNYGAGHYAGGGNPILEFRIPTDLIHLNYNAGDRKDRVTSNLEETKRFLGKPLNYSKSLIEFQYLHKKLLLALCTGIWDWSYDEKENPNFESVQEFHKKLFYKHPFRVPWKTNLKSQKLGKNEAEQVTKKKIKSEGYYQTIEYADDILQKSEEISKIARSLVGGLGIPYVSYRGDNYPVVCSICGDIFQDSLCNSCGHELEEEMQNPFVIEKLIQSKKKELLEYKNFFSEPLKWEYKVKEKWKNKGQKYDSPKFWINESTVFIIEEFESFETKLIKYSSGLVKLISEFDGNRELQKRAKRIKQDIEKTERDIKSIESIKN